MKKTAIITGSAKGMGFETAKELSENGYNVVLCARHSNGETESFIKAHSKTACFPIWKRRQGKSMKFRKASKPNTVCLCSVSEILIR